MNIKAHIETLRTIAEDLTPVSSARLAAAVIYRNKLVAIGTNQKKTHPFAAKYSKHPEAIYLHAETDAIYKAKKKLTENELKRATLLVVRVKSTPDGTMEYGLAAPCAGCSKCITEHNIGTVIYTENTSKKSDQKLRYVTEHMG